MDLAPTTILQQVRVFLCETMTASLTSAMLFETDNGFIGFGQSTSGGFGQNTAATGGGGGMFGGSSANTGSGFGASTGKF